MTENSKPKDVKNETQTVSYKKELIIGASVVLGLQKKVLN
jgi:hypothetical protein